MINELMRKIITVHGQYDCTEKKQKKWMGEKIHKQIKI